MEIALLVDKTNTFGLRQDVNIIREGLKAADSGSVRIREADPLEPPVPCDVAIHELPVIEPGMVLPGGVGVLSEAF
jgi:hypothetical protein